MFTDSMQTVLRQLTASSGPPIGLDIGASSIKMIQVEPEGGTWAVLASGCYQLPAEMPEDPAERRAVIADGCCKLLDSYPFQGRRVISMLPVNDMAYKNIRMPAMPPQELAQAVQWEARDRLGLGDQQAHIEYLLAGEVRHGDESRNELIVMAVNDEVLREHLATLNACGLVPVAIDAAPAALGRCFARQFRREADHDLASAFVDIGHACTKVLILRGQRVVFFKLIDIGGHRLDESVAQHLNISLTDAADLRRRMSERSAKDENNPEPALSSRRASVDRAVSESVRTVMGELSKEIGLCLRYYSVTFGGSRPAKVYVIGGEAHELLVSKVLADHLQLDVVVGDPLHGMDLSGDSITIERRGARPQWAMAAGLALRHASAAASARRGAA
jgi:type IV pilus assembly protein PilM